MSVSSILLLLLLASLCLVSVSGQTGSVQWSFYNSSTTCGGTAVFVSNSTSTSLQSTGNYTTQCQTRGENFGSYQIACSSSSSAYYVLQYSDQSCSSSNGTYSSISGNCDPIGPASQPTASLLVTCYNTVGDSSSTGGNGALHITTHAAIFAALVAVLHTLVSQLL